MSKEEKERVKDLQFTGNRTRRRKVRKSGRTKEVVGPFYASERRRGGPRSSPPTIEFGTKLFKLPRVARTELQ